jgi:hypothetical protein
MRDQRSSSRPFLLHRFFHLNGASRAKEKRHLWCGRHHRRRWSSAREQQVLLAAPLQHQNTIRRDVGCPQRTKCAHRARVPMHWHCYCRAPSWHRAANYFEFAIFKWLPPMRRWLRFRRCHPRWWVLITCESGFTNLVCQMCAQQWGRTPPLLEHVREHLAKRL